MTLASFAGILVDAMSRTFGKTSADRLKTCHPDLQRVFNEVIKRYDCSVICGHRAQAEQDEAFRIGVSKVRWPSSRHNSTPSQAVDAVPFPVDWGNKKRFEELAMVVKEVADELDVKISWGGDWKTFKDLPHYELEKG